MMPMPPPTRIPLAVYTPFTSIHHSSTRPPANTTTGEGRTLSRGLTHPFEATMLRAATLLIAGCLSMLSVHAADGVGAFMYALSKDIPNEANWWIVEVNPLIQREKPVKDSGISINDLANALAFDTARDQLIFLGASEPGPQSTDGVYVFDVSTKALTKFATLAAMQFPAGGEGPIPAGAAYYDNGKRLGHWCSRVAPARST